MFVTFSFSSNLWGEFSALVASIFTYFGVRGPILERDREQDAKKVPKVKISHPLLESLFERFRVLWESIF